MERDGLKTGTASPALISQVDKGRGLLCVVSTGDDFKVLGDDFMLRELESELKERSERKHSYNVKFSDNVGRTDNSR